jgi:hypothetical protein
MAIVRYPACERPFGCECARESEATPVPGCLWFFWAKRDDGGLGEVLSEALAKQAGRSALDQGGK